MVKINIKWNKVTLDNVEVDVSQSVDALKETILELTGVPKDRQKLMAKGAWIGTLKDDADLSKAKLTEGHTVMLMGSAEVVVQPDKPVSFLEDMTVTELVQKGAVIPCGLSNLGNTCYMNATVECLRYMPELRNALNPVRSNNLSSLLRNTFNQMDQSATAVAPLGFVSGLRSSFPQFNEMNAQRTGYVQQDAEEFYNTLIGVIQGDVNSNGETFRSLLGLQLEQKLKCQQCDEEPVVTHYEEVNKLVCNIQGGSGAEVNVNHMYEGVKLGFEGTIEKHSSVLNTNAVWDKKTRVSSLPRYLCFQFMRFFWKATPDNRDHAGMKCKILRAVAFPETIDVYELCNDELQTKLKNNRAIADKKFEQAMAAKRAKIVAEESAEANSGSSSSAMEVDGAAPTTVFNIPEEAVSPLGNGLPDGFTGQYELCGVVTHKGRSADSGHYIGWVRQEPGSDFWWCFDDEKVTETRTEEIMKLKGGGDREMAYLNFYRFKNVEH